MKKQNITFVVARGIFVLLAVVSVGLVVVSYENTPTTEVASGETVNESPRKSQNRPNATPSQQSTPQSQLTAASPTREPTPKNDGGSIITTTDPAKVQEFATAQGLTVTRVTPLSNGTSLVAVAEPAENSIVASIKNQPFVSGLSNNHTYRALYTFTDKDTYYDDQWNLNAISANQAWDISTGSPDVSIAVIDSGVLFNQVVNGTAYAQPDFPDSKKWTNAAEVGSSEIEGPVPNCTSQGRALNKKCNNVDDDSNGKIDDWQGWDFMGGFNGSGAQCPNYVAGVAAGTYIAEDNDPQPYSCDSPQDPSALNKTQYDGNCTFGASACYIGHGTMVASAAASGSNNGQLVAGVDHNAKIMNVRALDGYGYTTTDLVAAAIYYATDNGADVINLSLAVNDCSAGFVDTPLENAMAAAKAAGIVIVAASGNESLNTVCYPASSDLAIAVGALDSNDARASFSNYGAKLDVVAPGVNIPVANAPSSSNDSLYSYASGTSLATPHVAGLAGLIKATKPTASASEIQRIITQRADPTTFMNGSVFQVEYGYGKINAYTSVRVARGNERPLYELSHPVHGCTLLTSSTDERDIASLKRGYRYQRISQWLPREVSTGAYEPNATTNMCAKP